MAVGALRKAQFMGAMLAQQHNPVLRAFFERLKAASKPKKVAIIVVARKRLTILNAIVRGQLSCGSTARARTNLK